MGTNGVAVCERCSDALPVVVGDDGAVRTLRPGESCECGDEAFRVVPAETTDGSTEPPSEFERGGDVDGTEDVRVA